MDTSASLPRVRADTHIRLRVESVLYRLAESTLPDVDLRMHCVCDRDSDHYLLIAEGWQGYRRIYRTLVHLAVAGDDIHIYEDGTVDGVVGMLQGAGVVRERIICEWIQRAASVDAGCR